MSCLLCLGPVPPNRNRNQRPRKYCSQKCQRRDSHLKRYWPNREKMILDVKLRTKKRTDERFLFIKTLAALAGCKDCGTRDWRVIQWDHVRGEKLAEIALLKDQGRAWPIILAELRKCDSVCANCHQVRTMKQQGWRGA